MNLPESVKHLHGPMYLVPFDLIEIPEGNSESKTYEFSNPRPSTESGKRDLLDAEMSAMLRDDIKQKGLIVPLICRYVEEEDKIQLVGGERRYRALSYLIDNEISVRDTSKIIVGKSGKKEYAWGNAKDIFAFVQCQIYHTQDDFEALAYSYSENACRKNFNEGHDIALMLELRRYKASDDKILNVLQKNKTWLKEVEELVKKLDPATLNDLLEGRINALAASKLSEIDDVEQRTKVRNKANLLSDSWNRIKEIQNDRRLEKATRIQDIATVEVKVAEMNGEAKEIVEAKKTLENAKVKVADAVSRKKENAKATRGKDVVAAIRSVGISAADSNVKKSLNQKKINSNYIDYLSRVQRNDCSCLESEPLFEIPETIEKQDVIKTIIKIVKGIHDGEEDCSKILKKCFPK